MVPGCRVALRGVWRRGWRHARVREVVISAPAQGRVQGVGGQSRDQRRAIEPDVGWRRESAPTWPPWTAPRPGWTAGDPSAMNAAIAEMWGRSSAVGSRRRRRRDGWGGGLLEDNRRGRGPRPLASWCDPRAVEVGGARPLASWRVQIDVELPTLRKLRGERRGSRAEGGDERPGLRYCQWRHCVLSAAEPVRVIIVAVKRQSIRRALFASFSRTTG